MPQKKNFGIISRTRVKVDIEDMNSLPFFCDLNNLLHQYIDAKHKTSYIIWGGVAANLLLQYYKITNIFYSFHDIEIFFTKNNEIYLSHPNLLEIEQEINEKLFLRIGGHSVIMKLAGNSLNQFQENRLKMDDGDLMIHNIIIEVQPNNIYFEAPRDTLNDLISGNKNLELKCSRDLQSLERVSRRIYRTISKSIRFELVANLALSESSINSMKNLIDKFSGLLSQCFEYYDIDSHTKGWLDERKISSHSEGIIWLYEKTVSETTKRLAGIFGINSLNRVDFENCFFNHNISKFEVLKHPLLLMIENKIIDNIRLGHQIKKIMPNVCYLDFSNYQKSKAEKLLEKYSIHSSASFIQP